MLGAKLHKSKNQYPTMCLSNININLKLCWETSVIFASLSKSNYLPLLGEKTWNSDVWYFLNIHRWNLNTEGTDELRFVRDLWEMHEHVPKRTCCTILATLHHFSKLLPMWNYSLPAVTLVSPLFRKCVIYFEKWVSLLFM